MNIFWHGQSCFQIIASRGKNNQVSIIIDPFDETLGLRVPKLEADILLVSHNHCDYNNVKAVSPSTGSGQAPFLISGPGEYEIKDVFVQGISSFHDSSQGKERGQNTIYTIDSEDFRLCHLGDFGQKELTEEQLEKIGEVDILMIPIGGVYLPDLPSATRRQAGTISAEEALKIMAQIEPKITIPMHYQIPKLKLKLDSLDKFLKNLGIKSIESLAKLSIKKKDLSEEEAKIIVLKP